MALSHWAVFLHTSHHTSVHLSRAWFCKHSAEMLWCNMASGPSNVTSGKQALLNLGKTFSIQVCWLKRLCSTQFYLWSWLMQTGRLTRFCMFAQISAIKADSLEIKEKECCGIVLQSPRSQKCCCCCFRQWSNVTDVPFLKMEEKTRAPLP